MRIYLIAVFLAWLLSYPLSVSAAILYPDGAVRYPVTSKVFPDIPIKVGDLCDIVLQPREHLNNVVISDTSAWLVRDVVSQDMTHVFLKPKQVNTEARVVLITDLRAYHIKVHSTAAEGLAYVGFYYPAPPIRRYAPPRPAPLRQWTCNGLPGRYRISRQHHAAPFQVGSVCNDGRRTFVNMERIDGTLPILMTVGDAHDDQMVGNPTWDPWHNEYIVDGVPDHLALVRDSHRGQVRLDIERVR